MAKLKNPGQPRFEHVLLIDEDEIDNFINERMLSSTAFARNVVVRNSGAGALEYLQELHNSGKSMPDVIFLDLNMPVMDGFGFLEELDNYMKKGIIEPMTPRVIVLSSSISPADIDRASTNPHVVKYLNKPLSEKYLEAVNV